LRSKGKESATSPNAKVLMKRLDPGDAVTLRAGGGGGFGPPEERDPEKVAHDVRQVTSAATSPRRSTGLC